MASSWKVLLFSVAALAGLASAASPVWNGPTIPTAVDGSFRPIQRFSLQ